MEDTRNSFARGPAAEEGFEDDPFQELARLVEVPMRSPFRDLDESRSLAGHRSDEADAELSADDFGLEEELAQFVNDDPLERDRQANEGEAVSASGERQERFEVPEAVEPELVRATSFLDETLARREAPVVTRGYGSATASLPRTGESPASPTPVDETPAAVRTQERGSALDTDPDFDKAILNLSDPANPRNDNVAETGAFAPARNLQPTDPGVSQEAFDDFHELISSELAAISQSEPAEWHDDATSASADLGEEGAGDHDRKRSAAVLGAVAGTASRPLSKTSKIFSGPWYYALAAGVAVVAVMGGGLVFFQSPGEIAGSAEPVLIKADTDPVKVAPENPGGTAIPNQNKAVYARVDSGGDRDPLSQEALLVAAEEPIDLSNAAGSTLPGVDIYEDAELRAGNEAGVADEATPALADDTFAVLQPTRVKTLVVRPDGTVEFPEGDALEPAADRSAGADDQRLASLTRIDAAASDETTGSVGSGVVADNGEAADPSALEGMPAPGYPVPQIRPRPARDAAEAAPQAIGQPQPARVTSLGNEAVALGGAETSATGKVESASGIPEPGDNPGGYFVQISSQPSEALAEEISGKLSERYASLIGDRDVVIQQADIEGRGTYYRVRVVAGTSDEASKLCTELKSAGGSCFVAR